MEHQKNDTMCHAGKLTTKKHEVYHEKVHEKVDGHIVPIIVNY